MRAKEGITAFLLVIVTAAPSFSQAVSSHSAATRQAQVKQHSQLAQQYLSEHQPDLAIPELKAVVALDPKNLDARANLGVLLFFRGEYADAVPQLRAALKIKPDLWKIQALLGMSEERIGQQTEGRQDLETAFPHLEEEKIKMEVGHALIDSYTSTGDLAQAATIVSALLKLEPTDTGLLYTAFRLYSDLTDEAILTMAMTAPDSAHMHQMMARVLVREGDSAAAIKNYRDAIRINPKISALHFELAQLLWATDTVDAQKEAVAEYKTALELNPSDEKSESELARIAAQNGDTKEALADYSKAVEMQPNDAVALTGLAGVLIAQQQQAKALPLLERAVQLDPTSASAHFRLSTLYRNAGRPEDAKRELTEYLKYKKMQSDLSAIFKQMRLPPAKDQTGDVDATK
ncbi:MAG TPA: tetratricopeptide repeat protein [Acidobacteriaceae bacterium]|nr:tetratricopeptide repeat protein [Acidobacteriaceae bacterium]